ncbi:hypothetical protein KW534_02725 [Vibrio fluvialis]|nr:hypothetical protein [Vibrio fluvialis]MBY8301993.1 hypothetical protein [Vibrio fluvialis]
MTGNVDEFTQISRKALNILFVSNAQGTSLGVACGIISHGLLAFFMPTLKTIGGLDFDAIKFWHLTAFWVFIFNIKPYLNRHKPDPKIEKALQNIKDMESQGLITKTHAELQYIQLSQRVVASVTLPDTDKSGEPAQQ